MLIRPRLDSLTTAAYLSSFLFIGRNLDYRYGRIVKRAVNKMTHEVGSVSRGHNLTQEKP